MLNRLIVVLLIVLPLSGVCIRVRMAYACMALQLASAVFMMSKPAIFSTLAIAILLSGFSPRLVLTPVAILHSTAAAGGQRQRARRAVTPEVSYIRKRAREREREGERARGERGRERERDRVSHARARALSLSLSVKPYTLKPRIPSPRLPFSLSLSIPLYLSLSACVYVPVSMCVPLSLCSSVTCVCL